MRNITSQTAACALALVLLSAGCDPTFEGGAGNLVFTYDEGPISTSGWRPGGGSPPLARGAKLDYTAKTAGEEPQAVTLRAAETSDRRVLGVETTASLLRVEGLEVGDAEISVVADGPDGEVEDFFSVEVVSIDGMEFDDFCVTEEDEAAGYLAGEEVSLKYRMLKDGRTAVGWGHYPVSVEPAEAATVAEAERNGFLKLALGEARGTFTLESDVSDASFVVEVFGAAQIDGAKRFLDVGFPVTVGEAFGEFIMPTVTGTGAAPTTICQSQTPMTVISETPEICDVRVVDDRPLDIDFLNPYERRAVELEGLAEGECVYTVTFPEGADGEGVSAQFKTPVER